MFAIVQTGGKQYRVAPGDILRVERLPGDRGDEVLIEQVLLVSDGDAIQVGQPLVAGARVVGEIVQQGKAKKIIVFKKKRRKKKLTKAQRAAISAKMSAYRQKYPALFVAVPGDEAAFGGCLAGGRGFVHISADGDLVNALSSSLGR